jgi:Asp/Glu/hydantoin racemase
MIDKAKRARIQEVHPGIVYGGRPLYGIPVGMLMLEARFPRIPGDNGNGSTWPFSVLFRIVKSASPDIVVRRLAAEEWLQPFIDAAKELEASGVWLITTGCGFLVLFQKRLQEQLSIPILTSSLLQVPWVAAMLPTGKAVGVLTVEERSLTERHLRAAGIPTELPLFLQGLDEVGGYFTGQILGGGQELDVERCAREHEQAARLLVERHPEVGAIVLECTNMPPYAHRIQAATGLPVYDLTTMVGWAVSGLLRQPFRG